MTREEKITYCKECVHILKDYYYVQWNVMEDYQIENWFIFFKQELKSSKVVPLYRRGKENEKSVYQRLDYI